MMSLTFRLFTQVSGSDPLGPFVKFSKPKFASFTRHIWNYDQGNYDLPREKAISFDWDYLHRYHTVFSSRRFPR